MARELTETVQTRVSPDIAAQLRERAKADDRSVGAVVRAAIRSYLAKGKR